MIVVSGVMEISGDKVEAFVAMSRDLCVVTREEPGCAAYTFARSIEDPNRFEIFEEWADEEALTAHTRTDHYRAWGRALRDIEVQRMSIVRFDAVSRTVLV